MSLPIPLTVRLRTARADRHVTADARDLVMRWTDPGGYASCMVPLDRPLSLQPDEIGYYGQVTVYDARDGSVVWDGRMEDPGRSARDGQVWDLTAVGGQAHTRDRTVPLVYVDQTLSDAFRTLTNAPGATNSTGEDPGGSGKDSVILQFPEGQSVSTGSRVNVRFDALARAGMKLGRIDYAFDGGIADANYSVMAIASTNGGASDIARDQPLSTGGGGSSARVVGTHWTNGRNTLDLRLQRSAGGAIKVADDLHWAAFMDLVVQAMRYNANGLEKTTGYTSNTILASDVVADLLGRLLTDYDGTNAVIATTTHPIDQLAYPDGVTAAQVLDDLLRLEGGFTWRVWERAAAGKYRFEWVPLPSVVRYECDVVDGYDGQGSADGLYNMVTVRWRDSAGRSRFTFRSSVVPELVAAGLNRQASIDLGSEVGSTAAAQRAGDQFLAEHQFAPNGGRLRIARPILDLQTGRMVQPWEIRPGLIRVRGILPRVDALNASARDGVTVFRIVGGEYRASDGAATLDLDSYANTTPRLLSTLMRRMATFRRP
ncbi:hypothetical protein ACGF5C_31515 [Micromonospora sp. NPDC047620]|uniref:hypothetical protein n=1 Tax=Micromonospora sp. NPDC047620 TaxID=3364251 RepID=UPI0037196AE1